MPCKEHSSNYDSGDCLACLVDAREINEQMLTVHRLKYEAVWARIDEIRNGVHLPHFHVISTAYEDLDEQKKKIEFDEEQIAACT